MNTREAQFVIGQLSICGQYLVLRDVARTLRNRLGPGTPIRWDIAVILRRSGLVRMIGYRWSEAALPPINSEPPDDLAELIAKLRYPRASIGGASSRTIADEIRDRWLVIEPATLTPALHAAMEWQYDECDHGTYKGGAVNGKRYKMCEILSARMVWQLSAVPGE